MPVAFGADAGLLLVRRPMERETINLSPPSHLTSLSASYPLSVNTPNSKQTMHARERLSLRQSSNVRLMVHYSPSSHFFPCSGNLNLMAKKDGMQNNASTASR